MDQAQQDQLTQIQTHLDNIAKIMKDPPQDLSPGVTDNARAAIELMNDREIEYNGFIKEQDYLNQIMANMILNDAQGAYDCALRAKQRLGPDFEKICMVQAMLPMQQTQDYFKAATVLA